MAQAARAAVVIDAADYFQAVREAMLKAERSVFILGWDLHSQTRLCGPSGKVDDGLPRELGDFLRALVRARPRLEIHLLTWDFAVLYAMERELFPRIRFGWTTPARIHFQLDNAVPFGSSQHQKIVVIDDRVAFSGGLDLTIRRWDCSDHRVKNELRVDPAGEAYAPFHDVQMLVDSEAAQALGEIARDRWRRACGEKLAAASGSKRSHDPWPASVAPDFTDVEIGIARTCPSYNEDEAICEVEQLFLDSIDAAERTIYIENQFLTFKAFAERLARRLAENPQLEILIVAPEKAESWVEYHAMRSGRILFARELAGAGNKRVRILYPQVQADGERAATMIHSKVMIVDDRFLRVGSANLNNRSMAADTECDLAVEARNDAERAGIRAVRDRLIADHTGVDPAEVAPAIERAGSLIAAAERLSAGGHRLRPIDDGEADAEELAIYMRAVADPHDPIGVEIMNRMFESWLSRRQRVALGKLALAALVLIALTLVWHLTPLSEYANLDEMRELLASFSRSWYGPPLLLGIFILGGLVSFPLTILIVATAAAFGPWLGFVYAGVGSLASAIVTYFVGAYMGQGTLRQLLGPRLDKTRKRIARHGVVAVAAIRLVPISPFTVVNLAAGASRIPVFDYILGSALGLAPGLIVLSLLGAQIFAILAEPTLLSVALLVFAVAAWIAVTVGGQYLLTRYWKKRSR